MGWGFAGFWLLIVREKVVTWAREQREGGGVRGLRVALWLEFRHSLAWLAD